MLHKSFTQNMRKVQIEITTHCNLSCLNCDRSCRQAPSHEFMSLEQIQNFVDESISLNWQWDDIHLLGGEPTLHPNFFEVLAIINKYREFRACRVSIITNGFGEQVKKILSEVPDWLLVRNSEKTSCINEFSSYNVAPRDLEEYKDADFSTACAIIEQCGIGLTPNGYYPCGAGGALDRIFGFDIGIKTLEEVNRVILKNQTKLLCSYCGHFKDCDSFDSKGRENWIQDEQMSPTWKKAYEAYRKKIPVLSTY